MLFDLRGAGRRRTVKFVYLGLALIMFVGFVGFSIGSSGISGGIIDAITQGGGGGSDSSTSRFQKQVQQARAQTRTRPQDPAVWAALAQARVRLAGVGSNFDSGANNYTASGKQQLAAATIAWDRYMALNPKNPDDRLARQMLQAFVALNKPAEAVSAQEIVTQSNPTSATFQQLAVYAYQAGQTRKGDLAAGKAVQLAPKAERKSIKDQLNQFKLQAASQAAQSSATPSGR